MTQQTLLPDSPLPESIVNYFHGIIATMVYGAKRSAQQEREARKLAEQVTRMIVDARESR